MNPSRMMLASLIIALVGLLALLSGLYLWTRSDVQIISFEEAVQFARGGDWKWNGTYASFGKYVTEPLVTLDGLVTGYLELHKGNGSLYEVDWSDGSVHNIVERFRLDDVEEYYVWRLSMADGTSFHVDARNGDLLFMMPSRFPGIVTFEAAVRVIGAPEKKTELWDVEKYERIAEVEECWQTEDGLVRGHLLSRASDGVLYEVNYPFSPVQVIGNEILRIVAPEDEEQYFLWEIITQDQIYFINARNGVVKLILSYPEPTPAPTPTPTPTPSPELDTSWIPIIENLLPEAQPYPKFNESIGEDVHMRRKIFFYENGEEYFLSRIDVNNQLLDTLIDILGDINYKLGCFLSEEKVDEILANNRVVFYKTELYQTFHVWHRFKTALFILEDNLNEGWEGLILVKEVRHWDDKDWSCWAVAEGIEGILGLDYYHIRIKIAPESSPVYAYEMNLLEEQAKDLLYKHLGIRPVTIDRQLINPEDILDIDIFKTNVELPGARWWHYDYPEGYDGDFGGVDVTEQLLDS